MTARDAYDNTATTYGGMVHFTSSDGSAVLPADATLTNGTGSFNATLRTVGGRTITATDTTTSSITGTSGTIAVGDAAAPDTQIVAGPPAFSSSRSAGFTFGATDDATPLNVTYEVSLDNGPFAPAANPYTLSNLADGAHTLRVRATDAAGHTDATPAEYAWTVDTTPPTVNISAPAAGRTRGGPVTFQVEFADANLVGALLTTADVALTTTGTAAGTITDVTGSGRFFAVRVSNITGNGTLGIAVAAARAVDRAGNTSPAAAGPTVAVDNAAPRALSVAPSAKVITDALAGKTFALTFEFNGPMDVTLFPSLNFTANYARGTLSFTSRRWVDADTFRAEFAVKDTGASQAGTQVSVGGARDLAGNLMPVQAFNNVFSTEMKNPAVTAVTRLGPARVPSGNFVKFRVTFSEAVSGVTTATFRLAPANLPRGAGVTGVSKASATSVVVTVWSGTGTGLLRLDVVPSRQVKDAFGNVLVSGFTRGESVTVG